MGELAKKHQAAADRTAFKRWGKFGHLHLHHSPFARILDLIQALIPTTRPSWYYQARLPVSSYLPYRTYGP